MLGAASVSTWAQKNQTFGNSGSTWKTESSKLLINLKAVDDLQKADIKYGGTCDINDGRQKDVVVSGVMSYNDFVNVVCGSAKELFAAAKSLDMSNVEFVGSDTNTWQTQINSFIADYDNYTWTGGRNGYTNAQNQTFVYTLTGSGDNGGSTTPSQPETPTPSQPETSAAVKGTGHVTLSSTYKENDVATIHTCGSSCTHSLELIMSIANITSTAQFDLVKLELDYSKNKVSESVKNLNTYTLDLSNVTNMTSLSGISNKMVKNVILPSSVAKIDKDAIEAIKTNFDLNNLVSVIAADKYDGNLVSIDAYLNKPGFLANGLQYVKELNPNFNGNAAWYNNDSRHNGRGYGYTADNIRKVSISGFVFARDIKATHNDNLTAEGHLRPAVRETQYQNAYSYRPGYCDCHMAPSKKDPNVIWFNNQPAQDGSGIGAMLGSHITHYDFTNAEFGEYVNGVFKYYPADMTISELQYLGNTPSLESIILPTSPTQYIIPDGFIHDSKYIHEINIPYNYTEFHRFAFLGTAPQDNIGGISRYTTIATEDNEQFQVAAGGVIDNGPKTLTLPSTTTFVGRGAFSGYGGAALIEDVYVLAKEAPICEFYAFDQKSYVGQDSHKQDHLIKKGNYVNPNNGMAMLHFPYDIDDQEMINYSDMTRKYRLYDETGAYDNIGNILVWPTQAQYNRSFNQALAGVTWDAWKETLDGSDDPEKSYAGDWVAGSGDAKATHDFMFTKAAVDNAFSRDWMAFFGTNPKMDFGSTISGNFAQTESNDAKMKDWNKKMLDNAYQAKKGDRPLTYDYVKYGGWHQFTIAELYDFMLTLPNDTNHYYNFGKYDKNIWYAVCFPFNLTKKQLIKALGNPVTGEMPYLSTLAAVTRSSDDLKVTLTMSKNLTTNELIYEAKSGEHQYTVKCDKSTGYKPSYKPCEYGEDDIVLKANMPYFVLPCIPQEELDKIADQINEGKLPYRRSEITLATADKNQVMFPIATHVHAVNKAKTAYVGYGDEESTDTVGVFNYYFVGNYIPQQMPENSYYLYPYKKNDGSYWSTFYRNNPVKANFLWEDNTSIILPVMNNGESSVGGKPGEFGNAKDGHLFVQENTSASNGKTQNYTWSAVGKDDFVFFEGSIKQVYSKVNMTRPDDDEEATMIMTPDSITVMNSEKIYNVNGQFVGLDMNKLPKGFYIKGGKKFTIE